MPASSLNIFEVTHPLRYFFKLCGFACFTISPETGLVTVTAIDATLFILNAAAIIVLMVFDPHMSPFSHRRSLISIGNWLLCRYIYAVLLATSVNAIVWQRGRIGRILRALQRADDQLGAAGGMPVESARHRRVLVRFVIGVCAHNMLVPPLMGTFLHVYCAYQWWNTAAVLLRFVLTASWCTSVTAAYCFGLLAVRQRLQLLNDALLAMAQRRSPVVLTDTRAIAIGPLRQAQSTLCQIVDECNVCAGWSIMALLGASFGSFQLHMFIVYKVLVTSDVWHLWRSVVSMAWWCGIRFAQLVAVVQMGSRLAATGRLTGALVHDAINARPRLAEDTIGGLQLLSQQVLHRVPVASCRLFVFDWTLVYSVGCVRFGDPDWI